MEYLKNYGLTEDQIKELIIYYQNNEISIDNFQYNVEAVISILELFKKLGIKDFNLLLEKAPNCFFDTPSSVEYRINKYPDKEELAKLINQNIDNLRLINII